MYSIDIKKKGSGFMNNPLRNPIIILNEDDENTSISTAILPDGSHAPMTESNINAIAQSFESGDISSVMVSVPQTSDDGYECPIEMVEKADTCDDFLKIVAKNGLSEGGGIPSESQTDAVSEPAVKCALKQYSKSEQYPAVVSSKQNYSLALPRANLIRAEDYSPQQTKVPSSLAEKERFNAAKAAERIMSRVIFVCNNNALYTYRGSYYRLVDSLELKRLVRNALYEETTRNGTSNYIKDITHFIQTDALPVEFNNANIRNKVMFKNWVLNLDTLCLEQNSPHNYNTHALSVPYVTQTVFNMPIFTKYISDMANGDPVLIQRIWEILGLLISNDTKAKRIVVLVGVGDTGKSLFGDIVKTMIEDENVTSFTIKQLNDRFSGATLVNSAVNICMDLPSVPIDAADAAMLKNLSGGDTVRGEIKYMNSFIYTYQGHLLFGTNYPLKLTYLDQAFADRLLMIPCLNPIPKHLQDKNLLERIRPELPMVASHAVRAFAAVRKNGYIFTGDNLYSVSAEEIYTRSSINVTVESKDGYTVELFANQMCEVTSDINDFVPISELYEKYCRYCEENNLSAIPNSNTFSRELHNALPGIVSQKKRVNGKPVNVWCKIKLKSE